MKHSTVTLLITLFCCFFAGTTCYAQDDELIWRVGGQFGVMGATICKQKLPVSFTQHVSVSLDEKKTNSPWRWGAEAGLISHGGEFFIEDDSPDVYLRPSFGYVGVFSDYTIGEHPIFIRAGLAYSSQWDVWAHHTETKHVPLVITGIGVDVRGRVMFMLNGYIAPGGIFVLTLSCGIYRIHRD